mgnify:CR=1 FL=1
MASSHHIRTLHLVDLENLAGDPKAQRPEAIQALTHYLDLAEYQPGDQVLIAANPGMISQICFDTLVPCSMHAARGKDGADLVLLSHVEPAQVALRFGRLVIGSGDGGFADAAFAVRDRGAPVIVVSRRQSLSRRLQGEGLGIRILPQLAFAMAH